MKRSTREEVIMPIKAPPREIQAMRELLNDIEKYQRAEDASIAAQIISILITEAEHYKTKLLTK